MEVPTTKTEFLAMLITEHVRWDGLVAELDASRMEEPETAGEWSIKDVLVHVAGWERWAADQARSVARGEPYEPDDIAKFGVTAVNDRFVAAGRGQPVDAVLAGERAAFAELVGAIETMSDEDLAIRGRFSWSAEDTVAFVIAESCLLHYPEHAAEIRAWLDKERSPAS